MNSGLLQNDIFAPIVATTSGVVKNDHGLRLDLRGEFDLKALEQLCDILRGRQGQPMRTLTMTETDFNDMRDMLYDAQQHAVHHTHERHVSNCTMALYSRTRERFTDVYKRFEAYLPATLSLPSAIA